ncbi:acyl-CoA dehydrogenase family protein [Streptomyces sp. NPDC059378]|uniref:acyl-CoA dehydrogenase family protein n=1 Tax=Streptomyces sp. NPDC059378 TaxID=3346815 RepID=UPI0036B917F1
MFFTDADAVTDADLVVGRPGQGWPVAMTLLNFERAETYVLMPIKLRKLLTSEYHRKATELAMDVPGLDALTPTGDPSPNWYYTDDAGAPNTSASWTSVYLNARAATIYGGSSQIQRGIVGEMLLGLHEEPRPRPAAVS